MNFSLNPRARISLKNTKICLGKKKKKKKKRDQISAVENFHDYFLTFASPRNFSANTGAFDGNEFRCFQCAPHCRFINFDRIKIISEN